MYFLIGGVVKHPTARTGNWRQSSLDCQDSIFCYGIGTDRRKCLPCKQTWERHVNEAGAHSYTHARAPAHTDTRTHEHAQILSRAHTCTHTRAHTCTHTRASDHHDWSLACFYTVRICIACFLQVYTHSWACTSLRLHGHNCSYNVQGVGRICRIWHVIVSNSNFLKNFLKLFANV